jgi:putative membrane protein
VRNVRLVIACSAVMALVWTATGSVAKGSYNSAGRISTSAFVTKAAQGGIAEVALSQDAVERGQDGDVKTFAQELVTDHSQANEDLKQLAATKGWKVPLKTDAAHRAQAKRLSRLSGTAFDRAYVKGMVADHDAAVAMFQRYAKSGSDEDLKAWVTKTLPTLEDHQQTATALWDKLTPAASN